LTENGLLTGPGALTQTGPGTLTLADDNTYAGGTVLSNGVLALGSDIANNDENGNSGVGPTNSPVTFYGGTLQLYGYGLSDTPNYNTFYNPLVVPAGQTGTLLMFPRGAVNTGGGAGLNCSLSGGGTLNLVVNYVRDSLSGNWSAFTGLIVVTNKNASGDEMRINNNFGYSNAAIYLNGTLTMDSTLTTNATIPIGELGGVSTATIGPGNSSATNPTWSVGWKNTTNIFAGTIANDGNTSITKVGTGTWFLAGNNTFTGSTTISNGVLALTNVGNGDGYIGTSTNIFVNAGAFLDAYGISGSTMYLYNGQVLSGNGTITGILDTTGGGTVSPGGGIGGGIGTLTVTNRINLGGTAWMKINRTNSPRSDLLVSSLSYITYGGTLQVVNTGPALVSGDMFTLFSASSYNNAFNNIVFPNYTMWDTSKLAFNGTVKYVGPSAPPSFGAIDFSQLASGTITFNATNGATNGVVILLSSTNLALPISDWTPVVTNAFDGNGNLNNLAVTVDPTQPQEFYILQAY
jgi:autotransporter-associated beta strand protein